MSDGPLTCLVTGATGYVGGRLIPHLLSTGHRVRAMAREPQDLDQVPWREDVDVVRADLADRDSLNDACDGVDVLYYLVHSMGTSTDFSAEEAASGLVRPLVESLESDSVMRDRDVDTVIAPPTQGLTTYRDAVARAIQQPDTVPSRVEPVDPPAAEVMATDPGWARARTERAT